MKKANGWLSSFLEFYCPPMDGECFLTNKELSEHLKLSRHILQKYRKQRILLYILLCGKPLYPESEIQIPSPPIITSRLLMKKSEILIQLSQNEQRGTICLWSFPFVRYIHSDYANYCQNGVAYKYPLQRFIAPSKDFERFINAAFLIYSSVWITSSTFSFNFSNGLISSFVSCIQLLIL